jgi:hypothetical protein
VIPNLTSVTDKLWVRIGPALDTLAKKVAEACPGLTRQLNQHRNDSFPLWGYLAFMKNRDGPEIAVMVDVQNHGERVLIASDICWDDGRIVATGPSASFLTSSDEATVHITVEDWVHKFERWTVQSESALIQECKTLG